MIIEQTYKLLKSRYKSELENLKISDNNVLMTSGISMSMM
jgi:hypothetical protein